jgi:hypothetical protein
MNKSTRICSFRQTRSLVVSFFSSADETGRRWHAGKTSGKRETGAKASAGLQVEQVALESLKPDPGNARRHGARQVRQIASSIAAFGFNAPLLVDEELNVIAGHGRLAAAKRLGLTHAPAVRLSHLTAPERKAFAIADNRLAEGARWDERRLAVTLKGLSEAELNFDIEAIGFDVGEIDLKIEGLELGPGASSDRRVEPGEESGRRSRQRPAGGPLIPDPSPAKGRPKGRPSEDGLWGEGRVSRAGDAWVLGAHRVLCGDGAEEVDALVAKPEPALAVFGDPASADAMVRRWEASTGGLALLAATGESFAAVGERRKGPGEARAADPPLPFTGEGWGEGSAPQGAVRPAKPSSGLASRGHPRVEARGQALLPQSPSRDGRLSTPYAGEGSGNT